MPMQLDIVTAERVVLSEQVDQVNVSTREGRIGVLPNHAPLLTILAPGEMDIIKQGEMTPYALTGGFLEVHANRVTILADTVERADEIDEARAREARDRALRALESSATDADFDRMRAEAELERAEARLKVAQLRRTRR